MSGVKKIQTITPNSQLRTPNCILIVAGEASGDLHGSNLIKSLKEIDSSLVLYGIGGEKMKSLGFDTIKDSRELAVVGISEVFFKLGKLYSAFNKLKRVLDEKRPDVVVLIDFPDFNLHFAKAVKKRGIPIVYYISPQVWAWRKGRGKKIARLVDKMLVIFPFEVDIYKKAGVDVEYVGHPLAVTVSCQLSKNDALADIGMAQYPTVALLPGSRKHEIARLLPVMLEAAAMIKKEIKDVQFVLPAADTIENNFLMGFMSSNTQVKIVRGKLYEALKASDAAIAVSGTVTLETALMEIPMVIVYKLSFLTAIMGRIFVHINHAGLPNIVVGRRIVPELIQEDATPSAIAENSLRILKDKSERDKIISGLKEVGRKLGNRDASKNAAEKIYAFLRSSS